MYIFLWVVLDLVPLSKSLMERKRIKSYVKFFQEFRFVLMDYFYWQGPPSNPKRCKTCFNTAKFWCVDCKKKFCPDCTARAHAPGTLTDLHSIEELTNNWTREGVHLLSPILPEVMMVLFVSYFVSTSHIFSEDYMTRVDICPVVTRGRNFVAHMDAHLFYYLKDQFTSWCNREDSFWKLLGDAWVRGVVTGTDSSLLVFMNLAPALLFEVVVTFIMVPVVVTVYATLLNIIYQVELILPQTDTLKRLERITNIFDITTYKYLGPATRALQDMERKAPETKRRKREATDIMDAFLYWKNRKLKYFRYFYDTTCASLSHFLWQVTMVVVWFRLTCVWFGLGPRVRALCSALGGGGMIARHTLLFDGAGRLAWNDAHLWHGVSRLPWLFALTPESMVQSAAFMAKIWFLLWMLLAVAIFGFTYCIAIQRQAFWKRWKEEGMRDKALNFTEPDEFEESKPKRGLSFLVKMGFPQAAAAGT